MLRQLKCTFKYITEKKKFKNIVPNKINHLKKGKHKDYYVLAAMEIGILFEHFALKCNISLNVRFFFISWGSII